MDLTTGYPQVRLRRLRQNPALRKMLGQPLPLPERFIWPVFVIEGAGKRVPIQAMPGQFRYSIDELLRDLDPVVKMGIGGIMLFGVVEDSRKSPGADYAYHPEGLIQQAIIEIRRRFPELLIFTDVCVCAYTTHGHCGILTDHGDVDNDASVELLAKMAVSHACAGSHAVAPSAMMDGQVHAIRGALTENNLENTILLSYSTKFASYMYGPFREAADSSPGKGDRKGYQAPFNDFRQALRESVLDEGEGADMLMVKPSLFYLDIIAKIKEQSKLPLAIYNVSGEYAMLIASSRNGWGELNGMVQESTIALCRAGADILISYWANQYDQIFC